MRLSGRYSSTSWPLGEADRGDPPSSPPVPRERDAAGALRSPNIWDHPDTYELANRGTDREGRIEARIRELGGWAGLDVLDVGCGAGYHLPRFAETARSVVGIEPHAPLAERARARVRAQAAGAAAARVTVLLASAQDTGLAASSVDVAHARWAYFFGPGCEPGLAELDRVVRPGGTAYLVDVDATRSTFGRWFREAWPTYDPAAVERFWLRRGWTRERLTVSWEHGSRAGFEAVVRLEFAPGYADRVLAQDPRRTGADYAVNLWWRRF